jgi:hypothetical protein
MAIIDFFPPDGDSRLTAILIFSLPHSKIDFFPPDGNSRLTAIINFSLPHGKNRFHPPDGDSRLTAMLLRFCPERLPIRMSTGVI